MDMTELLTVKETADFLKTRRVQVWKMIQTGNSATVNVDRECLIPMACVQAFIGNRCIQDNCT